MDVDKAIEEAMSLWQGLNSGESEVPEQEPEEGDSKEEPLPIEDQGEGIQAPENDEEGELDTTEQLDPDDAPLSNMFTEEDQGVELAEEVETPSIPDEGLEIPGEQTDPEDPPEPVNMWSPARDSDLGVKTDPFSDEQSLASSEEQYSPEPRLQVIEGEGIVDGEAGGQSVGSNRENLPENFMSDLQDSLQPHFFELREKIVSHLQDTVDTQTVIMDSLSWG